MEEATSGPEQEWEVEKPQKKKALKKQRQRDAKAAKAASNSFLQVSSNICNYL